MRLSTGKQIKKQAHKQTRKEAEILTAWGTIDDLAEN